MTEHRSQARRKEDGMSRFVTHVVSPLVVAAVLAWAATSFAIYVKTQSNEDRIRNLENEAVETRRIRGADHENIIRVCDKLQIVPVR